MTNGNGITREIVAKLWSLCNVLRDDGITYTDYVTELTFLLFLKMLAETGHEERLPTGYRWEDLFKREGLDQLEHYRQLLLDLGSQESTRALARRLNHYATRTLLVIDEVGYLSYDARAADLLLQVVTRRYEKRSLVLTTNLPFSEWPTIFPNAGSAIALIDRLVHHAEILTIDGDSYRRRVAEAKRKPLRPASES